MTLQLDGDDQILEAALSLLDEYDTAKTNTMDSELTPSTPSKQRKTSRNYNPNRARAAQYQELLALRELVPKLQKRLQHLEEEAQRRKTEELATERNESFQLWKKMAKHQRETREHAEEENQRLREMVKEQAEISHRNMQRLLQTHPRPYLSPYRRMYAVPLSHCDGAFFRAMADSIDAVHHEVLGVFGPGSSSTGRHDATSSAFSSGNGYPQVFADKVLPFDLDATGAAAWQFFAHSFQRPTTRFYYHTDSPQSVGLVSDDTVVESFGEEHYFGQVMLDFKIKQIVRLYTATDRIVVAWRALISPEKFKGKSLSDILFEEKGALVIEPYTVCNGETASVVHTWQMITPDLYGCAEMAGSKSIQELAEFVITGCRPGRAVDSMERTLHMQVTPPGLIATH